VSVAGTARGNKAAIPPRVNKRLRMVPFDSDKLLFGLSRSRSIRAKNCIAVNALAALFAKNLIRHRFGWLPLSHANHIAVKLAVVAAAMLAIIALKPRFTVNVENALAHRNDSSKRSNACQRYCNANREYRD
jgi:hypothetical protein